MRMLVVVAFCWMIGAALTARARREPEPRSASAPLFEFSQARAHRIQQLVVGDAQPRAVGSAADSAAVERIAHELSQLDLKPTLQRSLACSEDRCGNITNLIARIDGAEPGCVLLVAHHDSVEASPGASDDGAGVAVLLETARALRAGPALRHGVIFLIDDGEEVGSLGAAAFASEHPWMRDVAVVINVDNGGTSGLALLYGTGAGNLGVLDAYAGAVPHPASSSLLAIGHALLPRTSDFTVFLRLGLPGLDLAFASGEARYHTSLDTVAHTHPGSLQHEGDSALALTRALSSSDLRQLVTQNAVWFDLFGYWVLRWPAAWSLPLAILALALLVLATRRMGVPPMTLARAATASFVAALVSAALAFAAQTLLTRLGMIPAVFVREPRWLTFAMFGLGGVCVVATSARLARFDPLVIELGVWWAWAAGTVVTALTLPGASILFLPVTLMAASARALFVRSRGAATLTHAAAAFGLASVWFPGLALAPETFGISALVLFAAPAVWIGTLLLPGLASLSARQRRLFTLGTGASLVFGLLGHALACKFDYASPQRVNVLAYTDATAGRSVAILDTTWGSARSDAPAPMLDALTRLAGHAPKYAPPFAWDATPQRFAPLAGSLQPTAAVTVSVSATDAGATTLQVQLTPNVRRLSIVALEEAPISDLTIGSQHWPSYPRSGRNGARYRVWQLYAPARDAAVRLLWHGTQHPLSELTFVADTGDLPESLRALVIARPRWAAASQTGDRSVVSTRITL